MVSRGTDPGGVRLSLQIRCSLFTPNSAHSWAVVALPAPVHPQLWVRLTLPKAGWGTPPINSARNERLGHLHAVIVTCPHLGPLDAQM